MKYSILFKRILRFAAFIGVVLCNSHISADKLTLYNKSEKPLWVYIQKLGPAGDDASAKDTVVTLDQGKSLDESGNIGGVWVLPSDQVGKKIKDSELRKKAEEQNLYQLLGDSDWVMSFAIAKNKKPYLYFGKRNIDEPFSFIETSDIHPVGTSEKDIETMNLDLYVQYGICQMIESSQPTELEKIKKEFEKKKGQIITPDEKKLFDGLEKEYLDKKSNLDKRPTPEQVEIYKKTPVGKKVKFDPISAEDKARQLNDMKKEYDAQVSELKKVRAYSEKDKKKYINELKKKYDDDYKNRKAGFEKDNKECKEKAKKDIRSITLQNYKNHKNFIKKINDQINADSSIEAVILNGDNAGGYGKKSDLEAFLATVYDPLNNQVAKRDGRVFTNWGNHDTYWTSASEPIRTAVLQWIKKMNGDYLYAFNLGQLRFISLGLYPTSGSQRKELGDKGKNSLGFLQEELKRLEDQPVVIFFHYPIHGDMSHWWSKKDKDAFYEAIKGYNVLAILVGHSHDIAYWKFRDKFPVVKSAYNAFSKLTFDPKNPTKLDVKIYRTLEPITGKILGTIEEVPVSIATEQERDLSPDID